MRPPNQPGKSHPIQSRVHPHPSRLHIHPLFGFGGGSGSGEAEAGSVGIENTVESVEEGIAIDVLLAVARGLEGAEADLAGLVGRGKVEVVGGDGGVAAIADCDGERGEGGGTGEDVTAQAIVQLAALDGGVVVSDLVVAHEDQGGSGV